MSGSTWFIVKSYLEVGLFHKSKIDPFLFPFYLVFFSKSPDSNAHSIPLHRLVEGLKPAQKDYTPKVIEDVLFLTHYINPFFSPTLKKK